MGTKFYNKTFIEKYRKIPFVFPDSEMYRMTPLETTHRVLMWLCIVPSNNFSTREKVLSIGLSFTVGVMILAQLVASAMFVLEFYSTNLESSLYAVYQFSAWMPILYIFVIALLLRHKITAVLCEISNIYDTSNLICSRFLFV